MDWKEYEHEIEDQFRLTYPAAQLTHNAKLVGKFSKVERQIDLLIEEQASDFAFRIVIDAKYRGRKIDVSDVEAFIGLTRDVQAHTGMMVALEGYTPAAVNRAHNDDLDVILDVLNLAELKKFQGFAAFPYSGDRGVSIAAPFGWIIDATQRPGMVATLYERGITFEDALKRNEFMYVNFWDKRHDDVNSLDTLLKYQEEYMLEGSPNAEIRILEKGRNRRLGNETLIRRYKKNTYPTPEYTGFVDFEDFIFMCVLFTPENLERKNLRKLRSVISDVFPMTVKHDHKAEIAAAEARLNEPLSLSEKASLLSQLGRWHRKMGEWENARKVLEERLTVIPEDYETIKQLLDTLTKLGNKEAILKLMARLLRLDPRNPTVFDDCISYSKGGLYSRGSPVGTTDLIHLLETLRADYPDDNLVSANCDFYSCKILVGTDVVAARKHLSLAKDSFRQCLPSDHQALTAIRSFEEVLARREAELSSDGTAAP